ncbi:PadR family transcriptional regulator [Microbacterium esteraromaticum]|uniref:PadR family transcriptional regulator n=1 Tax=Microbacterium esteraromaticum TaxID=57043 RepID=UPI00236840C7|nr:PadR family transcriptional regulator [Microbacterium esteraromaticum]WDH77536.1 PadR family transcriptional regulator [Microbacterium esteraromaticum]
MAEMTRLQFDILTALAPARRHGYALIEEVERMTKRRPGVATLYAALNKLENAGFVIPAGDEIVDGRVRRYFVLSPSGVDALATEATQMATRSQIAMASLGLRGATA